MKLRVSASPLGILLGLSLAACFLKPDPPGAREDGGGSTGDTGTTSDVLVGDAKPGCTRYEFDDVGSDGMCGEWPATGYGLINVMNSQLSITAQQSNGGGSAGCTGSASTFESVTFQVSALPTDLSTTTEVFVSVSGARHGARFDSQGFKPMCDSNASTMIPWGTTGGIRITDTGTAIRLEYNTQGTWTFARECGSARIANAMSGASVLRSSAGADVALVLDYVDVCP
jgi:hypothetical protein